MQIIKSLAVLSATLGVFFYASAATIDPQKDNPLTVAGELTGANCDAAQAFEYLSTVKGANSVNIKPVAGVTPGISANFACRLAEYIKAVRALGCNPQITSGYRSYAKQLSMCGPNGRTGCAAPGASCHQYGAAIDMVYASPTIAKACKQASDDLAGKYGLIYGYASSKNKNIPGDNRTKGGNHFQCIENKSAGKSSGCNVNACGPGTPPPYDSTQWNQNVHTSDPGPGYVKEVIPPPTTPTPGADPNKATVVGSPYDGQTPGSGSPATGDNAEGGEGFGPGGVNWDDGEGHDTLFGEGAENELAVDGEDYDSGSDSSYSNEQEQYGQDSNGTNNSTGNFNTNSDTQSAEAAQRENTKRSLLYNLFNTPLNTRTASLYKQALFGNAQESSKAIAELNSYTANESTQSEQLVNKYIDGTEQSIEYTTDDVANQYGVNYTPWYLKYSTRRDGSAASNSNILANFFYGDLPPQDRVSPWQIILRMFKPR